MLIFETDDIESKSHRSGDDNVDSEIEMQNEDLGQTEAEVTPVATGPWKARFEELARGAAERESCEIYDWELVGSGGHRTLRVMIDRAQKEPSQLVSIEDCANVSRALNLLLDVEDIVPGGAYHLEVSSPGLERPLKNESHFQRAVGQSVSIKTFEPLAAFAVGLSDEQAKRLGKDRQLVGRLAGFDGSQNTLSIEVTEARLLGQGASYQIQVPLDKITKAQTVFVFEQKEKPKGKSRKH